MGIEMEMEATEARGRYRDSYQLIPLPPCVALVYKLYTKSFGLQQQEHFNYVLIKIHTHIFTVQYSMVWYHIMLSVILTR